MSPKKPLDLTPTGEPKPPPSNAITAAMQLMTNTADHPPISNFEEFTTQRYHAGTRWTYYSLWCDSQYGDQRKAYVVDASNRIAIGRPQCGTQQSRDQIC